MEFDNVGVAERRQPEHLSNWVFLVDLQPAEGSIGCNPVWSDTVFCKELGMIDLMR